MTKAQSRIRLNTYEDDQADKSYISISLQKVVAMAECELNIATDLKSLNFLDDKHYATDRNVEFCISETSTSNPADSFKSFKDVKYEALFDGTSPGDDNLLHISPSSNNDSKHEKRESFDDKRDERRETPDTIYSIESQIRENDAFDEDFLPNRQGSIRSIEKSMKPPRSKVLPPDVCTVNKGRKSTTPTPDRSFKSINPKVAVGSTSNTITKSVLSSHPSSQVLKHSESKPKLQSADCNNNPLNRKQPLPIRKADHLPKNDVKLTQRERSNDVEHTKSHPNVFIKSTMCANTEIKADVTGPAQRLCGNKTGNAATLVAKGKIERRKSYGLSATNAREKLEANVSTVNSGSKLNKKPLSARKNKKKARVRIPNLSPKLRRLSGQLPPVSKANTKTETEQSLARKKISPNKGFKCKAMSPKIHISNIRRDIRGSNVLRLAEETNIFLKKGIRETTLPVKDVQTFKPTVPKSPSFQKPFVPTKYLTKTKTMAEQTQAFLSSGLRNNTPMKKNTYTLTTPVSPHFSTNGRESSNMRTITKQKSLTLAEETNLFLRTGFRENIPPTNMREFKPTVPKSPSFQKPCRLFSNVDLPKTKTLAEQTQEFYYSGLRNNTPVKRNTCTLTTPVSPNFSTRSRNSLNMSIIPRRKSISLAEVEIQKSSLREINKVQSVNCQKFTIPITPNLHKPYSTPMPDTQKAVTLTEKRDLFIREGLRQGSINIPPCIRVIKKPSPSPKTDDLDMQTVALGMIDPWQD